MKNQFVKRILSVLLCIAMLLTSVPVYAGSETEVAGSFYLTASTAMENIIEPTLITYKQGQSIKEALMDSAYEFEGISSGFIGAIEGVSGNYSIFFDDGAYDLTKPASSVKLVAFAEGTLYSEEMAALIIRMGEYNSMTNNVQNYDKAKSAYREALAGLKNANADRAKTLLDSLNAAISEYENLFKAEKYTVSVTATQGGAAFENPVITLTDEYGNETTNTGASVSVIAGKYDFSISDGAYNRTEGTVDVSEDLKISVTLPQGEWFDDIQLLDSSKNAFEYTIDKEKHTAEYFVDDTVGTTGIKIYAVRGKDLPLDESGNIAAHLYACYEAVDGSNDYGSSDKASNKRSWESKASSLVKLVDTGMDGRDFAIEARYTGEDGYVMIQSYETKITRVPTLTSLIAKDGNGSSLLSGFASGVKEYSFNTINSILEIEAEPYAEEGYSVSVDAAKKDSDNPNKVVIEGNEANKVEVKVSHSNGQSRTYTLNVTKINPAKVSLSLGQDVSVSLENANGSIIEPVSGSDYELIPGETYTYIATKGVSHHTSYTFTAVDGLKVDVATPEDVDTLSEFAVYNASSAKTRKEYEPNVEFNEKTYEYEYTVPDTISALYVQATGASGYTVTARYNQQHILENSLYNGVFREQKITNKVGATTSAANLTRVLAKSAFGNEVVIRVWKTAGNVTYYQDYAIKFKRSLSMEGLNVFSGSESFTLLNEEKELQAFDRDVKDYYIQLPSDIQTVYVGFTFPNVSDINELCGGYYAMIGESRYDNTESIGFVMDSSKKQEDISIKICNEKTDSESNTYTLHILKIDPVEIKFNTTPKDATIFLTNQTDGKTATSKTNVFKLIPGQKYSYTVTASGYVGTKVTDYVVPENSDTINLELTKAEVNDKLTKLDSAWPSFRADNNNNGVVSGRTPIKDDEAVLYWATKKGSGYGSEALGCPILAGGYLYAYAGSKIVKMDTVTGEIVAEGDMDRSSSFAINSPTYGDGMIFVGLSNGGVQAFNADTLESLWIYKDELGGQPNCQLTYYNGYVYTGFWNGEEKEANYVCLSVTDKDPSQPKEEKKASWTHKQMGGFYWAGAYVSDNFMLVGTDDGKSGYTTGYSHVLSFDPKSGTLIDDVELPHVGDLRCNILYDEYGTKDYYFTTKGGYFYGISVNDDGTFKENSLKYIKLENGTDVASMSTSTPTIYNGRAYVGVSGSGQFSANSGHNITVLDLTNWKIAYRVITQGYPQTSGILTNAYEEENGKVYVYFFENYTPGKLRMLSDMPGQTEPAEYTEQTYTSGGETGTIKTGYVLFTPTGAQAQYAICSPIVDEYGTLYFKNDSAHMMAVGSTIEKIEVTKQPDKTEYALGNVFDGTGMEVMATYTNGTTRDISKYVTYSTEPLTVNDTEIQISFEHVMYQDKDGQTGVEYTAPMTTVEISFTVNVDYVNAKIDSLDENASLDKAAVIKAAKDAYELLSDEDKAAITNYDKLARLVEELGVLEAAELVKNIDALVEVSLDNEAAVISARTAYEALPESCKSLVTNLDKLEVAEAKIAELKADKAAADAVIEKIAAIGEVSLESEVAITEAEEAYALLSDAQKLLVDNYEVLKEARKALDSLNAIPELGDVNEDGIINAEDALAVLKDAAKLELIPDEMKSAADVNKDEIINAEDALLILKKAAKLIEEF